MPKNDLPRNATLTFSSCFFASRNSDASTVQPEVLAFGKKNRITRFPRKSDRDTSLPSSPLSLKSGALSPVFSIQHLVRFASYDRPLKRRQDRRTPRVLRKQAAQNIIHRLGIRLSSRSFHYLADKKLEYPFVPTFEFRHVIWIFRDHLARRQLDRR